VGHKAGLDAVVKRKIPSPYKDMNPRSSSSKKRLRHEQRKIGLAAIFKTEV
jgi:hypothetical protein